MAVASLINLIYQSHGGASGTQYTKHVAIASIIWWTKPVAIGERTPEIVGEV